MTGLNQASLNAGTRPMTGPIQASVVEGEIALQKVRLCRRVCALVGSCGCCWW